MNRTVTMPWLLIVLFVVFGCSTGKLSRREASHQIDAMMKPHPVGPKKLMWGLVPAGL